MKVLYEGDSWVRFHEPISLFRSDILTISIVNVQCSMLDSIHWPLNDRGIREVVIDARKISLQGNSAHDLRAWRTLGRIGTILRCTNVPSTTILGHLHTLYTVYRPCAATDTYDKSVWRGKAITCAQSLANVTTSRYQSCAVDLQTIRH